MRGLGNAAVSKKTKNPFDLIYKTWEPPPDAINDPDELVESEGHYLRLAEADYQGGRYESSLNNLWVAGIFHGLQLRKEAIDDVAHLRRSSAISAAQSPRKRGTETRTRVKDAWNTDVSWPKRGLASFR